MISHKSVAYSEKERKEKKWFSFFANFNHAGLMCHEDEYSTLLLRWVTRTKKMWERRNQKTTFIQMLLPKKVETEKSCIWHVVELRAFFFTHPMKERVEHLHADRPSSPFTHQLVEGGSRKNILSLHIKKPQKFPGLSLRRLWPEFERMMRKVVFLERIPRASFELPPHRSTTSIVLPTSEVLAVERQIHRSRSLTCFIQQKKKSSSQFCIFALGFRLIFGRFPVLNLAMQFSSVEHVFFCRESY